MQVTSIWRYLRDRVIQNRFSATIIPDVIHRAVPTFALYCNPTPSPM